MSIHIMTGNMLDVVIDREQDRPIRLYDRNNKKTIVLHDPQGLIDALHEALLDLEEIE